MLNEIVETRKKELESIDQNSQIEMIKNTLPDLPSTKSLKQSFYDDQSISIIAEIKRRSPSKGILAENLQVDKMARLYEKAGASAISVLTENNYFDGSIGDLKIAKENSNLPILRKDFILEEYQVWESRFIGADAILLIVAILEPQKMRNLYLLATKLQ